MSVCVGGQVCSFGFVSICLILHLPFVWGTFFISWFFVSFLFVLIPIIAIPGRMKRLSQRVGHNSATTNCHNNLWDLGFMARDQAFASGVKFKTKNLRHKSKTRNYKTLRGKYRQNTLS